MRIFSHLVKPGLAVSTVICFLLVFAFCSILPVAGQPTSLRDLSPVQRKRMALDVKEKVNALTEQIKKDAGDAALYKERLRLYFDLLELNFDNAEWEIYADKFEEDLSTIIKLEGTAAAFKERASFLKERLRRFAPFGKINDLYPRNRHFEQSASDYLESLRHTSDSLMEESIYTALGDLYVLRPEKAVSTADFQKWRTDARVKLILNDLQTAVKYVNKTLEVGVKQTYPDVTAENSFEIYMRAAKTAARLGAYQTALDVYEMEQAVLKKYPSIAKTHLCSYYEQWGNIYLKLNQPDKAIEKFNKVSINKTDNYCIGIFEKRADAYSIKKEFQRALSDYGSALSLDEKDSLKKIGLIHIKRANLYFQTGNSEQALNDLNIATANKYTVNCPELYRLREKVYRKLGKFDEAEKDRKSAISLQNQANCQLE